jgi:hypothetical protein
MDLHPASPRCARLALNALGDAEIAHFRVIPATVTPALGAFVAKGTAVCSTLAPMVEPLVKRSHGVPLQGSFKRRYDRLRWPSTRRHSPATRSRSSEPVARYRSARAAAVLWSDALGIERPAVCGIRRPYVILGRCRFDGPSPEEVQAFRDELTQTEKFARRVRRTGGNRGRSTAKASFGASSCRPGTRSAWGTTPEHGTSTTVSARRARRLRDAADEDDAEQSVGAYLDHIEKVWIGVDRHTSRQNHDLASILVEWHEWSFLRGGRRHGSGKTTSDGPAPAALWKTTSRSGERSRPLSQCARRSCRRRADAWPTTMGAEAGGGDVVVRPSMQNGHG